MHNYTQLARKAFPPADRIIGTGRWAVSNGSTVYLCLTEAQQRNVSLGIENPVKQDLEPKDFSRMPDLEDKDERRARRRAQQC